MKQNEFEELVRKIVEQTIDEKMNEQLEEKIEAMFYKTLVEGNFMTNVISTVYENVDKTSNSKEVIAEQKEEPLLKQLPKRTTPAPIPDFLKPMGAFFEGTTPLDESAVATAKARAMTEGINPDAINEDGVDLDLFSNAIPTTRKDIGKFLNGE
jgi:hypothetical protein